MALTLTETETETETRKPSPFTSPSDDWSLVALRRASTGGACRRFSTATVSERSGVIRPIAQGLRSSIVRHVVCSAQRENAWTRHTRCFQAFDQCGLFGDNALASTSLRVIPALRLSATDSATQSAATTDWFAHVPRTVANRDSRTSRTRRARRWSTTRASRSWSSSATPWMLIEP